MVSSGALGRALRLIFGRQLLHVSITRTFSAGLCTLLACWLGLVTLRGKRISSATVGISHHDANIWLSRTLILLILHI